MGQRRSASVVATLAVASAVSLVAIGGARAAPDPGSAPEATTAAAEPGTGVVAGPPPPTAPTAPVVAIAPVAGRVVRPFDPPATPYGRGHRGVDLAASPGEVVRAALSGTVTFAGRVAAVGWVTVAHADGLSTTYGRVHPQVDPGDRVVIGQVLGRATNQGRIDWGARLAGTYIDPLGLLGGWTVRLVPVE